MRPETLICKLRQNVHVGRQTKLESSMLRFALVTAAVLCATQAQAYCPSAPDTASTNYVENSTAHTLCLQQELTQTIEQVELEANYEAQIELLMQQRQQQQFQSFDPFAAPQF
jgi:hypothetical protein